MKRLRWWFTFLRLKLRGIGARGNPLLVDISRGTCSIDGLAFQTADELEDFLLSYKPAHVAVLPTKDVTYARVADVMRAAQKVGAWSGITGYEKK